MAQEQTSKRGSIYSPRRIIHLPALSLSRLVTIIAFLGVFVMAARVSMDTDTWWHLRAGQWMVEQRSLPWVDHFSYTRLGEPWEYPGWPMQILMFVIFRLLGPGGLNLWTALMVTLAMAFLWKTLAGGPFFKAFILFLAATVSGVYWAARPYLVTFLLSAVFLWILEEHHWRPASQSKKCLWWLPPLMVLWANSHGGFAVGFLLWGVYLAGDLLSRAVLLWESQRAAEEKTSLVSWLTAFLRSALRSPLLLPGLLMLLAVCINPYGPVILAYPFKTVGIGALQDYIQEWQPPDFHSLNVQPFAWLMLAVLASVGASRRRMALTDFLLVAGFFYMGLLAARNIALFALAAPPALARHLEPVVGSLQDKYALRLNLENRDAHPETSEGGRFVWLNWVLLLLLVLASVGKCALVFPASANEVAFQKSLPLGAVQYLKEAQPPGRLFNSYNWGGYLLWALPEYPVFVDGRTDLYNDEIINQWLQATRGEAGWQEVLERWGVNLVLLEPRAPLIPALEQAGWQLLYKDELSIIYSR